MRIEYQIEDRGTVIEQINASGMVIVNDVTINLVNGRFATCYFEVVDAPLIEPSLADADARILELEYENLLLQEGLA